MGKMIVFTIVSILSALGALAEITVSDVTFFSGYPWKEVVVGYTITGEASSSDYIRLTATDKSTNLNYVAIEVTGAEVTEGRHVLRWNAAADGVKISSTNVVFVVSVINVGGVQLWANGPYWAECNVGAKEPEELGYHFQMYDGYSWYNTYATVGYDFDTSSNSWMLVANGASFLFANLVDRPDAAIAHLGASWRIPTRWEWEALIRNCTASWTTRNGVNGMLVTGRGEYASKSIFLPTAGYWSFTWPSDASYPAWPYYSNSSGIYRASQLERDSRCLVRPLREFAQ